MMYMSKLEEKKTTWKGDQKGSTPISPGKSPYPLTNRHLFFLGGGEKVPSTFQMGYKCLSV